MFGLRTTSKALLGLTPVLLGAAMVGGGLDLEPESRLWVEGTSTVRSFKCTAGAVDADITTARADAAAAVYAGEKAVTAVTLQIPAMQLDCNNGTMNNHMRKALKVDAAPMIAFELASYDLLATESRVHTKMTGTLTLGGTAKPITVDADLVQDPTGGLRVKGSYDLRMTEYGLKPPSLMMGTMKVHELVKVNFDLLLKD